MKKHVFTATALAAVLSMAVATAASAAEEAAAKNEKCFGVAKAGKNDCGTAAHSCAGASKADGGAEWVNVPVGLCDKLVGGSTTAPVETKAEEPKAEEKKQ